MDEQFSMLLNHNQRPAVSDAESSASSSPPPPQNEIGFSGDKNGIDIIRMDERGGRICRMIKNCFINGLGPMGKTAKVVAVHGIVYGGLSGNTRVEAFRIFSEAVKNKCGGDCNMTLGWYGGSKNEIDDIVKHGFAHCKNPGASYGLGLHLSPPKFSINSALQSDDDNNGVRHILLCRVILGKMEQISEGSEQVHPSSEEFDSGVDNLADPRRYIVWSSYMNSHILPTFIVSFKAFTSAGPRRNQGSSFLPKSPYMMFPNLLTMLAKVLGPSEMDLLVQFHSAFQERKVTKLQLVKKFRQIAGDKLLREVVKSSINKQPKARDGISYGANSGNKSRQHKE